MVSCSDAISEGSAEGEAAVVGYDLIGGFAFADAYAPIRSLDLSDTTASRYLSSGWNGPDVFRGVGGRWTNGHTATIDLPVFSRVEQTLQLAVTAPPKNERLAPQSVRVLWNGKLIQDIVLPPAASRVYKVKIPAEAVHLGVNRLSLLPLYWISGADKVTWSQVSENVGVLCSTIEVLSPGGTFQGGLPNVREGRLVQPVDTIVSYYLAIPPEGTLNAQLSRVRSAGAGEIQGNVDIAVVDNSGEETELFRVPLGKLSRSSLSVDVDLGSREGKLVALTLAVTGDPSGTRSAGEEVVWEKLEIEGRGRPLDRQSGYPVDDYNVFLIAFDTLRPDYTEPYGARGVSTPSLNGLASEGITFLNSYATASWTRPSVASYLSSLYPKSHGVVEMDDALGPDVPWLPEILQGLGYSTLLVLNNGIIGPKHGFARGFDVVHELYRMPEYRSTYLEPQTPEYRAEYVWKKFVEPFLATANGKPWMVYLHEQDPHSPYTPSAPFDRLGDFDIRVNISAQHFTIGLVNERGMAIDDISLQALKQLYGGEVAYMDAFLGGILDRLRSVRGTRKTLVVFLSDHGEEFYEHGFLGHTRSVYEETLRTPLIVSLPGVLPEDRRIEAPVQLTDVPVTVLNLVGGTPPATAQGRDLLEAVSESEASSRPIFGHISDAIYKDHPGQRSVRLGRWKLVVTKMRLGERERVELFDLEKDPGEKLNLWAGNMIVGKVLRKLIDQHLAAIGGLWSEKKTKVDETQLDEETLENLKTLGYVE